ncbi:MAG: response regulator [Gammaproteobacteria bacterium]|nr:response regulator [Gammaproteobacteria bacterium]
MRRLGLQNKIILLVTIPIILVSLIISYLAAYIHITYVEHTLNTMGRKTANHVASASEFSIFSENSSVLKAITKSFIRDDALYVGIHDARGVLLAESGSVTGLIEGRDYLSFIAPITASQIDLGDYDQGVMAPVGHVKLIISRQDVIESIRMTWIYTLIVSGLCILTGIYAGRRFSRRITRPLLELSTASRAMRAGVFRKAESNAAMEANDEIAELVNTFNDMALTIRHQHENLETGIKAATTTLHKTIIDLGDKNRELELAREDAVRAEREKSNFLARMSHEMRSPINAISGFANILNKTCQGGEQQQYTSIIIESSQYLNDVINDILGFAKLDSGDVNVEHQQFDVGECLEVAVTQISPSAHEKGLELILNMPHDINLQVVGDVLKLKHIVSNLLNNAVKFTERGHILVDVCCQNVSNNAIRLIVEISDTGIGIPSSMFANIFKPFFQADTSLSRNQQGTGLGLAIVKRLADVLGATISFRSTPGQGTTFMLEMPIDLATGVPHPVVGQFLDVAVLIYDENSYALRSIRNNVLLWSDRIFVCRDINQFCGDKVNLFGGQLDLIIVGLSHSAELNDRILATATRVLQQRPSICFIFLLASEMDHLPAALAALPNVRSAVKPIRRSRLYTLASALLQGPADAAAPAPPAAAAEDDTRPPVNTEILVAEDNRFNRELIRILLEGQGYQVTEADNGEDAWKIAEAMRFDLIISDIHLPRMDGIALARRIHGSARNRMTPIIAMTADVFARSTYQQTGVIDDWILKPINEDTLWQVLGRHLKLAIKEGDTGRLNAVLESNADLRNRLVSGLHEHARQIEHALDAGDLAALRTEAHQIAGMAGYYGLSSVYQTASMLDQTCNTASDIPSVEAMARQLVTMLRVFELSSPALTREPG